MSKAIPSIQQYMTTTPEVISPAISVTNAQKLFNAHHMRHLPVVENDRLVGLVAQSDLRLFETLDGIDPDAVPVKDVMQLTPFHVSPAAALNDVVEEMAAHKYGSAVVVDNGKVVGIFTTIDAMNALSKLLQTRLAH